MDRSTLIEALRGHVDRDARIRVAWLGGSDATGRTDEFSDIDPMLVARGGDIEAVIGSLEAWLEATVGIRERHRFPEPTPHGHPQVLYLGDRVSENLAIDLMVMDVTTPVGDRFLDVDRHGRALVLVDHEGWFDQPVRLDRDAHRRRIRQHLATLESLHPHVMPPMGKSVIRGHRIDALARYHKHLLRPLCDLMRIEHDPDRFDFGFRYLDRDLPDSERRLLERMASIGLRDDLAAAMHEARCEVEARLERLVPRFRDGDDPEA